VSRGTLREAIRQLYDEGLVEILPHRGAFVARLSRERAKEIYTLRALLEPYAVRVTAEMKGFDPHDLDELDALVDHWGELEKEDDIYGILEAEIEFHRKICQRSGHRLLLGVLDNLVSQTQLFILHTKLYQTDLVPDKVSHRAILDAIRSGDPASIEDAVRQHIVEAGDRLISRLEALELQSSISSPDLTVVAVGNE
jgi:DNA-binding GntR family transcriptional regulator